MLSPLETALTGQPFRRLYCRMLDELVRSGPSPAPRQR